MMGLTPAQLTRIGFRFVMDAMSPSSPYGRAALKAVRPYPAKEADARDRALRNIERALMLRRERGELVARLEQRMMTTKDIRASLALCAQGKTLTDIELFEIKCFLLQLEEIVPLFGQLSEGAGLEDLRFEQTGEALALLDPEKNRVASFHLSVRYSEKLAQIRRDKQAVELAVRRCADAAEKEALMGRRLALVTLEQAEEAEVRAMLSQKLGPFVPALLHNCAAIATLDLLLQKAALVQRFGGCRPHFGGGEITLRQMRNPMLAVALEGEGRAFAPVSITLCEGATVITGANMGGKSVVLKTLALNVLLCHCGFFPFAEKAVLTRLDAIHLVSEDLEAAERGLSSFGGEIVRLKEVLDCIASQYALILLDEFARGTNPNEGAAIAHALTRWLDERAVFAVLTTHFERVAEAAGAHWRVAGLMEADWGALARELETRDPAGGASLIARQMNYSLVPIDPQEKIPHDAIEICRLLGLSQEIVGHAKKRLTFGENGVK